MMEAVDLSMRANCSVQTFKAYTHQLKCTVCDKRWKFYSFLVRTTYTSKMAAWFFDVTAPRLRVAIRARQSAEAGASSENAAGDGISVHQALHHTI